MGAFTSVQITADSQSSFDAYPMSRVEEIFNSAGAAKILSTLD